MSDTILLEFPAIIRGDTYTYNLTFTDKDGVAIDITGWSLKMVVKPDEADAEGDALINVSHLVPSGAEAQAGRYGFVLTSDDTAVDVGTHHMYLQRIISGAPDDVKTIKRQAISIVNP